MQLLKCCKINLSSVSNLCATLSLGRLRRMTKLWHWGERMCLGLATENWGIMFLLRYKGGTKDALRLDAFVPNVCAALAQMFLTFFFPPPKLNLQMCNLSSVTKRRKKNCLKIIFTRAENYVCMDVAEWTLPAWFTEKLYKMFQIIIW